MPVHIVSARLGHSSPVVTLSVCAHVLRTDAETAAEAMAKLLGWQRVCTNGSRPLV